MNGNHMYQLVFSLLFVLMSGGILSSQEFSRYEITDAMCFLTEYSVCLDRFHFKT